ncbi:unnamed protein product [Durusdinium trenchii]|uniref:SET domain-containing protein n=2 Tax=Durusdinium trenchii TaxID=1381693 RepID=A0ABP0QIC2_9DINO
MLAPPVTGAPWAPNMPLPGSSKENSREFRRSRRHRTALCLLGGAVASHRLCSQRAAVRTRRRIRELAAVRTDEATSRFVTWMDSSSIKRSAKLEILPDKEGRCVVCTQRFDRGELLVQLPAAAAISVEMSPEAPLTPELKALEPWWRKHPRSSIRLAAKLVFQREQFGPYIDMLYPLEQIYAPWRWKEQDLQFLPQSLVLKAQARKEALEAAYQDLEQEGLSDAIPEDLFLRAHHAVASRAFAGEGEVPSSRAAALAVGGLSIFAAGSAAALGVTSVDFAAMAGAALMAASGAVVVTSQSPQVLSLLPMIDQVNHRSGAPPDLQFDPTNGLWQLRATRAYEPGEEIVFSYGDKDSDALLLQHGFVEEDNGADQLRLMVPEAGSFGLSAEVKSELAEAGIEELCFDGSLEKLPVSKRSLTEVVEATLRCAAGDCRRSEDAKVAQEVSSPGIGRVLLCWRGERRKLLKAAATQWQVEDLIAEIED